MIAKVVLLKGVALISSLHLHSQGPKINVHVSVMDNQAKIQIAKNTEANRTNH